MGGNVDGTRGDTVIIAPPFNASTDELDQIVERFADSVRDALAESADPDILGRTPNGSGLVPLMTLCVADHHAECRSKKSSGGAETLICGLPFGRLARKERMANPTPQPSQGGALVVIGLR